MIIGVEKAIEHYTAELEIINRILKSNYESTKFYSAREIEVYKHLQELERKRLKNEKIY